MNELLDEKSREVLIRYRLDRAEETVKEAEIISKEFHHKSTINLYYGFYYATSTLFTNDISFSSYTGTKNLLDIHFVNLGLFQYVNGYTLSRIYEIRHSDEYDFVYCAKAMVEECAFYKKITKKTRPLLDM